MEGWWLCLRGMDVGGMEGYGRPYMEEEWFEREKSVAVEENFVRQKLGGGLQTERCLIT